MQRKMKATFIVKRNIPLEDQKVLKELKELLSYISETPGSWQMSGARDYTKRGAPTSQRGNRQLIKGIEGKLNRSVTKDTSRKIPRGPSSVKKVKIKQ